jgi:eukaryotic-like serine/threonine-protein kinase
MIDHRESIRNDELDEAFEQFERCWTADASYLQDFVGRYVHINYPRAIGELIRADIDRRYAAELDVDLPSYFTAFPSLLSDAAVVSGIGFEDLRSRRSRSLPVSSERWSWMPGIGEASWYTALRDASRVSEGSVVFHSSSFHSPMSKAANVFANRSDDQGETTTRPFDSAAVGTPRVGYRFGDFQLLAILGRGSFSTVFLATQYGLASRYVALKVVRRPLDEPTHLARLQHTGIVPLYSVHRIGSYSALCMPYFGSATLADWLGSSESHSRNGQSLVGTVQSAQMRVTTISASDPDASMDGKEVEKIRLWNSSGAQPLEKLRSFDTRYSALWLTQRLTAALAHAHERGVIHGDLKPANVLLRNDGEPALIDFNLSKGFGRNSDAWAGGTLPYMSPEQLQALLGQTVQIDATSDVYSLGVMLFELVEERLPFSPPLSQADSDITLALANRRKSAAFNRSTATHGLMSIIRKCLRFSPRERYASALLLLEDVERELAHRPLVHARESLIFGGLPKLVRRYPRIFSAGPVALVSLLVIGLFASQAFMGWKRSQILETHSRLARFQDESKLLMAEMVDPIPTQWESLLSKASRLTEDLLAGKSSSDDPSSLKQYGIALLRLSPEELAATHAELVQFCLAVTALTCGSVTEITSSQRAHLQQVIESCAALPGSTEEAILLKRLSELFESNETDIQVRFESMMRSLEDRLDTTVAVGNQRGLIELLQARTNVRQGLARSAMERLQSIDVHAVPAYLYWMVSGDTHLQLQQFEAAMQSYGLAVGASPKSIAAFVQRAEAALQLRNFKSAEEDYARAIELMPTVASLYMRRALLREKLGNVDAAIGDMNRALDLEPKSNRMLLARARMHHRADHRDPYLQDFKSGLTTTPKNVEDWVSRALAQLPRYPEKAKKDLQEALAIDADSQMALQNLAHVESEHLHDMAAAKAALDKILQLNAESEGARAGRSVLLARQSRVDECMQDLKLLAHHEPRLLPSTLYLMGCAHALISSKNQESSELAMRLIALALRRGYGSDVIATDPDLDSLRELPLFSTLLTIADLYRDK